MERAHGRWHGVLPALGVPAEFLNGKHQPCPICGGKDRARFTNLKGDGDYFCSQCGSGTGLQLLMRLHGWDFRTAAERIDAIVGRVPVQVPQSRPDADRLRASLRRLWLDSKPVQDGDPVSLYLARRGLSGPVPGVLRYVPEMHHRQDGGPVSWRPGMVALVSDAAGKPVSLHRTYLTRTGAKADVPEVRKLMPGTLPRGAAIRLAPVADELGIAEGIETALAASRIHGVPCWAAISDRIMGGWEPPAGVSRVVVFGDCDANFAGQFAAYELAKRLSVAKQISVDVCIPPDIGTDWNDVLMQRMERVA